MMSHPSLSCSSCPTYPACLPENCSNLFTSDRRRRPGRSAAHLLFRGFGQNLNWFAASFLWCWPKPVSPPSPLEFILVFQRREQVQQHRVGESLPASKEG